MRKITMTAIAILVSMLVFSTEKMTSIPITGGFGITLGETFTPRLEKKLKAKREKYDDKTLIGYKVVPPHPFKGFTNYSVLLTKDRKIYKIQATCISPDTETPFSNAAFLFQKKYGTVSGVRDEILFIDKKNPTRSIRISRGQFLAAIVYSDSAVGASDVNDI